jgi:hypothetical protein
VKKRGTKIRLDTPHLAIPPDRRSLWRRPAEEREQAKGNWGRFVLRFISKIDVIPDGCWLWRGQINQLDGSTVFRIDHHTYGAHRIAYRLFNGPIPHPLDVLHTCATKSCVKPHHLRLGRADIEALAKYGPPVFRVSAADLAVIEAREGTTQ